MQQDAAAAAEQPFQPRPRPPQAGPQRLQLQGAQQRAPPRRHRHHRPSRPPQYERRPRSRPQLPPEAQAATAAAAARPTTAPRPWFRNPEGDDDGADGRADHGCAVPAARREDEALVLGGTFEDALLHRAARLHPAGAPAAAFAADGDAAAGRPPRRPVVNRPGSRRARLDVAPEAAAEARH